MNGPISNVLVHIDGSEESILACEYAVCLCKSLNAELTALYVINTKALDDLVKSRIFIESEEEEYQHDLEADADKYLSHVKELAESKGLEIKTIKKSGAIHTEIKNHISENNIDLLIVGEITKIRSRRDEFFNETERAMRSASCSVLIVKDEERVWNLFENMI